MSTNNNDNIIITQKTMNTSKKFKTEMFYA